MKKNEKKRGENKGKGKDVIIIIVNGEKEEYTKLTPELKRLQKMSKSWKGLSEHHLDPKVRGGKSENGNLKNFYGKYHSLIHELFGNLLLDEKHLFLEFVNNGRKKTWCKSDFKKLENFFLDGDLDGAMNLAQFNSKQLKILEKKNLANIVKEKSKKY